jgi:hypothetical protein
MLGHVITLSMDGYTYYTPIDPNDAMLGSQFSSHSGGGP